MVKMGVDPVKLELITVRGKLFAPILIFALVLSGLCDRWVPFVAIRLGKSALRKIKRTSGAKAPFAK